MRRRKIFAAVLAGTLAASSLCGCAANNTGSTSSASASSASVSEASDKSGEPGDMSGSRPEKPDGEPGDMSGGPGGDMSGGPGGAPGGSSAADIEYTAVMEYSDEDDDASVEDEEIESTGTDENAVLLTAGGLALYRDYISRVSSDSTGGDDSSFYGVGAAVLATGGKLVVEDCEIDTDAAGGAGVFAYGDSEVYVTDTSIWTEQDTSGGIHAAGGGTLYATDLDVTTNGASSAAIRSDRGGGTMRITGGDFVSNGSGSPAVYCTADIAIQDASLKATGSEAVCIEGLNTLRLYDCDLEGDMPDDDQNDTTWTVILYQSMSGDSEVGNSTFAMQGGKLTSNNGGLFCTTNTESSIILESVKLDYSSDDDYLLMCTGNTNERGWGSVGSNGADCNFTAIDQYIDGKVVWDSVSTLDFYLTDESTFTGYIVDDETWAGDGGDGECSVYIEEDSVWRVTEDSEITNLYCAGEILDEDGSAVTIKGTDGTVYVKGDSSITITVESYEDSCDTSGAESMPEQSDYFDAV